ncbi:MAG: hypothetical protein KDC92_11005 [Bacteroidetes bacterium]|nr:hypothetical protein [Bacteroidota bacterium]
MAAVTKRDDVVDNLKTFENHIRSRKKAEKEWAVNLLLKATHIVIYKVNGENHFAPAEFCHHSKLTIESFEKVDKDIKEVDKILTKIIGHPFYNDKTEEKHVEYVKQFGDIKINPDRQFWRVKDERGKNYNFKV